MVAALAPDLDLVGATTVNGNTTIDYTTENTLRVLDWIGRPEIPVVRGLDRPLARPQISRGMAERIHGDLLDLPPASHGATIHPGNAVDWLIETYLASDGDIVLCPVGPLTNIAMAIVKEPRILEKIPEIVIMGGAHHEGNQTASAEFNFWIDPEAARVVVHCGRPIRMVPLTVPGSRPRTPSGFTTSARPPARRLRGSFASGSTATRPPSRSMVAPQASRYTTPSLCAPSSTRRSSPLRSSRSTSRSSPTCPPGAASVTSDHGRTSRRTSTSRRVPTRRDSSRCSSTSSAGHVERRLT